MVMQKAGLDVFNTQLQISDIVHGGWRKTQTLISEICRKWAGLLHRCLGNIMTSQCKNRINFCYQILNVKS